MKSSTQQMFALIFVLLIKFSNQMQIGRFPMLMPNVRPYRPELYLCTPVKVDYTQNYFITGFEPNATMHTAHHMLLYGCGEPGSDRTVWNCGEMNQNEGDSADQSFGVCAPGSATQIIYAWARDAPKLELPPDVGFKVGKDSEIKYLVLQVHYMHAFGMKDRDDSGVFIHYTMRTMPKLAAVLLLGTGGIIRPNTTENMETACRITENKVLHPFAYRTHTHSLGKVVSGYRVRKDFATGHEDWLVLGKRDPLTPQMFYPTLTKETIKQNDIVAARCTMKSNRDRITKIGATNNDEMCNFYLMYYVENGEPLNQKFCFSAGPLSYSWKNDKLNEIPDDASSL